MFLKRSQLNGPLQPAKWPIAKKNQQNVHPQLILMTLQESLVIKVRKTTLEP